MSIRLPIYYSLNWFNIFFYFSYIFDSIWNNNLILDQNHYALAKYTVKVFEHDAYN